MMRSSKPSPLTSPAEVPRRRGRREHRCRRGGNRGCRSGSQDRGWRRTRRPAEHHIAFAGARKTPPALLQKRRSEIVEAVAVDVPGRGDRDPAVVASIDAVEPETSRAIEGCEIDAGAEPRRLADTTSLSPA